MSEDTKSMWDLGSGLPLDGARVTVVSAEFTYNQEYAANAVVLDLGFQHEDPTQEVKHQLYSVGGKWEPLDGGTRVGHQSGKFQPFNEGSNIGKLIKSYILARGQGDFDKGLAVAKAEGIEPDHTEMWLGMDVTLKTLHYATQKDKGTTELSGSTMMIDVYHGKVGAGAAGVPTQAQPASASASASSNGASSGGATVDFAEFFGAALYRKLKKAAKDADDHDAFMDTVFDKMTDDMVGDDKAWNKQAEKLVMDTKPDSLYASSRG